MNSGFKENQKKPSQIDDRYNIVELPSDYENSSWFGRLTFLWQWRFFLRHYKKEIGLKDLPKPRAKDEADYVHSEFLGYWQAEVESARKSKRPPNLIYPIFRQYGLRTLFMGLFCFVSYLGSVSQSLYLGDIIQNFNDLNEGKENARWEIAKVCVSIFILALISKNAKNAFNLLTLMTSLRVRVCLSELIYRKALRLSRNGFSKTSTGQVLCHLTVDMNRIDNFWKMLPYPAVSFALLAYVLARLWKTLAHFSFYGLIFLVFVIPIQSYIGRKFSSMRLKAAAYTDKRISLVNELLNSIKIIKLMCWENPFAERINVVRKKEIAKIKKSLIIFSIALGLFASTTKIIVFIILLAYYLSFNSVTDRVVYLTLSVFNQTTFLITIFVPEMVMATSNFFISIKRINRFLALEESAGDGVYHSSGDGKEYALAIKNLTACVTQPPAEETVGKSSEQNKKSNSKSTEKEVKEEAGKSVNILKNVDFKCKQGELVLVVGAVGSSKTSLLQAILSELQIKEGHIAVNGRLAYAPQDAWIFGGSIRENILFDSEFDEIKYNEVLRVCALERDLSLFEDGDRTLIGEKGISLSGGQKARIGLARALYFDADIYLLDDPLSAVDAHVSKHLFKLAISEYLKQKTVLLCTHQLNYVKYAEKLLFLRNGEQVFFESSEEFLRRLIDEPEGEFAKFVGSSLGEDSSDARSRKSSLSLDSIVYDDDEDQQNQQKEIEKMVKEKRIREEDAKLSFIYKAYLSYFKYGRIAVTGPLLVLAFGLAQLNATSLDYFLKLWTDSIAISQPNEALNTTVNSTALSTAKISSFTSFIAKDGVYVYFALIVCFFVLCMTRVMSLAMFCMHVSVKIHKSLFDRIVRANMKFFYTNPVGIILNRFSRDIEIIDSSLWNSLYELLEVITNDVVIYVILAVSNPMLIIPFTLFIIAVIWYRVFYITTARALQTLEGVSKSPQVEHLASTLNGMSTVRAFRSEKKFIQKFHRYQNDYTAARFILMVCKRWFVYVLEHLQLLFLAGTLFAMCLLAETFSGSLVGFILTNVLMFTTEFQWGVQCWANLEQYLCSVDRIETIGKKLDPSSKKGKTLSLSEPPLESSKDCKPPNDWPQRGEIEFRDVTLRYFQNEAPALNNLKFSIPAREKVGIVGRTGAGKSSILAALFRLSDFEGEIIIDGIDCKSIGLHDLRSNISIIPQESILFTGTLRGNLDPLHEYEDHQLWSALRAVQLEQVVKELEGGLDSKVIDNGSNFSMGQKQLICLARAILKENKILVLDEATANTDPATDELIQATIRSVFQNCTILTIAHRINTIIDADRILVMDAGECKEFDTPKRLLADSNSLFSSMVDAYGEEQSRNLRRIAFQVSN